MKKVLMTVLIVLTMTTVALTQQRRGGPPPQGERQDPNEALKAALGLTDAQVSAVQSLMQTRQSRAQAIQSKIDQKRQAFETAINLASPNPSDVGNAAIALRATAKRMAGEREWFLTEFKRLLTTNQVQTLESLIAAGAPLPGLGGPGMFGPRGGGMRRGPGGR